MTSAQHNGYGVDGIAPNALPIVVYPEVSKEGGSRRAEAVTNMCMNAKPGDTVMLEQQTTGAGGGYGPAELSMAVWTASKMGVDAGVIVLLYRPQSGRELLAGLTGTADRPVKWDARLFGVGAQILRALKVGKMRLMSNPRKIPSMTGFGLEITGFVDQD